MIDFFKSSALLLVLLNPFLLMLYLVDVVEKLDRGQFTKVLIRAALIASVVFSGFAVLGDAIFADIVQVKFASFQIFGGVIFLIIGLQFVFRGPRAIEILRGESQHLAGAIAMPVFIGPGTISASVIIGKRLDRMNACAAILFAVVLATVLMLLLKSWHDFMRPRNAPLIQRYIEVAGRITALYVGAESIDMIMQGLQTWGHKF